MYFLIVKVMLKLLFEVQLALDSAAALTNEGKKVRVVSMPSTNVFDKQDAAYKESVLPKAVTKRVAIEAAHVDYWYKYVGLGGKVIGMTDFGASAPASQLFEMYGFTADKIAATVTELL